MYVVSNYSVGKFDLLSVSHDLVSEVLKNRGSANSRLRKLGRLEGWMWSLSHTYFWLGRAKMGTFWSVLGATVL